ncbi:hypothetical protein V1278_003231 [Bradyrhizobium sp. AZCC 1577]
MFVAALAILAQRARSWLRIPEVNGWAERSIEAIRRRCFSTSFVQPTTATERDIRYLADGGFGVVGYVFNNIGITL